MTRQEGLIILLVISAILVIVNAVILLFEKTKYGQKADLKQAKEITLKLLKSVGLALVTEAERTYGSGTGVLKLSTVMNEVLKLLPAWITEIIDTEWLTDEIERVLTAARIKWEYYPNLLGENE